MKHIKRFRLFENQSDINKLISDINDLCLELNDIDIRTECQYNPETQKLSGIRREYISLMIEKELYDAPEFGADYLTNRWIDWVSVKDISITVLEYMKDNGWKPQFIILDGDYHRVEDLDVREEFLHIFEPNRKFWGLEFDFIQVV